MKLSIMGVAVCLAAAGTGVSSYAGEHRTESQNKSHQSSGMRSVAVVAKPGEPAHGWRYFSDPRKGRAVVISPSGDYYYSHGEGLELVFRASRAA